MSQTLQIPKLAVDLPLEQIEAYCEKWHIKSMELFGSVLRDDFGPESDIDVLVTFDGTERFSLFDLIDAEDELAVIFGRPVDLVERSGIERSENWIRRRHILNSAKLIYAR